MKEGRTTEAHAGIAVLLRFLFEGIVQPIVF